MAPGAGAASTNRKMWRRVREPIGLTILAEASIGHHSYAAFRRYVSYWRYAPVQPMTRPRPRPPVDPPPPDIERMRAEFDKRVEPLFPALDAAAFALMRSPEDAEDLRQDAVMRAWEYAGDRVCRFHRQRLYAFLRAVMRNCWKTRLADRKTGRVGEPSAKYIAHALAIYGDSSPPQEQSEALDLEEHLSRAIERLPPPCRRALELVESGKTYRQTAEIMNVPVDAVWVLVRRARRLLKKDFEAHGVDLYPNIKPAAKKVSP